MRGAILQKQEMIYTHINKIFSSLNNIESDYNWLLTDMNVIYTLMIWVPLIKSMLGFLVRI